MMHQSKVLAETEARAYLEERLDVEVPFVESHLVADIDGALRVTDTTGYPVTVKGVARGLAHKASVGAVANDVRSPDELRAACQTMATSLADHHVEFEGFMVQPYARAGLDVFLAAVRDSVFGVCAVIGRGGGSVEASGTVQFVRAVDLDEDRAQVAFERALGSDARYLEVGNHRRQMFQILSHLTQLVESDEAIADVELNPVRLVRSPEPQLVVLDALVTMATPSEGTTTGMAPSLPDRTFDDVVQGVRRALQADSICLVGVSRKETGTGYSMLRMIRKGGYQGKISIVHPAGGEVHGIEAMTTLSIDEIGPQSFDVVMVSVGEAQFAEVLNELAPHDVGAIVGLTSPGGEGKASESMVRSIVESKQPVVGPNTAGYLSMPARLRASFGRTVDMDAIEGEGNLALVTQSGSVGSYLLGRTFSEDLHLRYWVPTGNELNVRLEHVLSAVADDHVDVIALFIEGIRNGSEFIDALRKARSMGKLITAYGVGETKEGQGAAQSHTAAMAGNFAVLKQVLESEGVLVADSLAELFDITLLGSTTFRNTWKDDVSTWPVTALSTSGGSCSITAEQFARNGQPLPELEPGVAAKLMETLPSYATIANPIDVTSDAVNDPRIFVNALDILATEAAESGNARIVYLALGTQGGDTAIELAEQVVQLNQRKPMRLVVSRLGPETLTPQVNKTYRQAGIPVFGTPNQAVDAICRLKASGPRPDGV